MLHCVYWAFFFFRCCGLLVALWRLLGRSRALVGAFCSWARFWELLGAPGSFPGLGAPPARGGPERPLGRLIRMKNAQEIPCGRCWKLPKFFLGPGGSPFSILASIWVEPATLLYAHHPTHPYQASVSAKERKAGGGPCGRSRAPKTKRARGPRALQKGGSRPSPLAQLYLGARDRPQSSAVSWDAGSPPK